MLRRVLVCLCFFGVMPGALLADDASLPTTTAAATPAPATPASAPMTPVPESELVPALREMCSKKIVLLGEDANHAGARTIAVKAQLVEALVRQCGFRGVVFESQFYDMLDVQHSLDAGTATEAQLSSAIGALWSRYADFRSFEAWLFRQASDKRVLVAGVDPQVGGIGARYSQEQLPTALAAVLDGGDRDRARCEAVMARHNAWTYDDAHPFDEAEFDALEQCARKVTVSPSLHDGPDSAPLAAMASSYLAYVSSIDPRGGDPAARDKAMYQNLAWQLSQWPKDTRVVIWTASVHASTSPGLAAPRGAPSLGTYARRASGDQVYALGFSALGGAYGSTGGRGPGHELVPPPPDSLEARAFASGGARQDVRFLPAASLRAWGSIPARVFNYSKFQTLPWSDYLDGILVLRAETPAMASP